MKKIFAVFSVLLTAFGMKAFAQSVDSYNNDLVYHLSRTGLNLEEIDYLNQLSINDPELFRMAVLQDLRIKGTLKQEIFASANKGGGPCIHGGQ